MSDGLDRSSRRRWRVGALAIGTAVVLVAAMLAVRVATTKPSPPDSPAVPAVPVPIGCAPTADTIVCVTEHLARPDASTTPGPYHSAASLAPSSCKGIIGRFRACWPGSLVYSVYKVDAETNLRTLVGRVWLTETYTLRLRASGSPDATATSRFAIVKSQGEVRGLTLTQRVVCSTCTRASPPRPTLMLVDAPLWRRGSVTNIVRYKKLAKNSVIRVTPTVQINAGDGVWRTSPRPTFRCDRMSYVGVRGGCVFPSSQPTLTMSRSSKKYPQTAAHIQDAQRHLSHHWGSKSLGGSPLSRTRDATIIQDNRDTAGRRCRALGMTGSCDEYPFASTRQGCAQRVGCDVAGVPLADNRFAGAATGGFYRRLRVLDGDRFWLRIVK